MKQLNSYILKFAHSDLLFTVFKIDNFACGMYCFLTAVFLSFARLVSWMFTLTSIGDIEPF